MGTITRSFANLITASGPSALPALGTITVDNIQLPSTAVASANANNLDDYEEGTWTPIIFGTTTAGTGTYIVQGAVYTKIGKTVSVAGFVGWSAHTGTGNMKMGGLPFTTLNNSNANSCFALSEIGNITTAASNILTLQVVHNTTDAQFSRTPVGGGVDASVTLDVAGYFRFSTTYFV